jgi:hypothetical protein
VLRKYFDKQTLPAIFMTRLIIPYSIFIIPFQQLTTFLLLSSSHHVDKDFLVINFSSLVIFPLTAYFLYKNANSWTKSNSLTIFLLILTGIIFTYYTHDFFKDIESIYEITWFTFVPLMALILTLVFIYVTIKKRQLKNDEKGN